MAAMTPPSPSALRDAALEFLHLCAAGRVEEAYGRFAAPNFRHHNPHFRGDAASLAAGMADNARQFPNKQLEILRSLAEGELVALHCRVRMTPDGPGIALIHIFRFESGRIAELWDVGQFPPEQSPNEFGMF